MKELEKAYSELFYKGSDYSEWPIQSSTWTVGTHQCFIVYRPYGIRYDGEPELILYVDRRFKLQSRWDQSTEDFFKEVEECLSNLDDTSSAKNAS